VNREWETFGVISVARTRSGFQSKLMSLFFRFSLLAALAATFSYSGFGQSSSTDLRRQVADLIQDVNALRSTVGALRIEVEALNRENNQLKTQVAALGAANAGQQSVMRQVDAKLAGMKAELLKEDAETKKEIVASVTRQIDSLAKQMSESLRKIAGSSSPQVADAPPPSFSDDYPKDGIMYLVQPGDTISEIATTQNSRVEWIRDANKIVNASRDLRAGATIFVPQASN